ncbi:MAG: hypothetical protein LUB61_05930 [Eggerthellaceae bacterium]|nr:hypothetical protein [Eggerthellaceae bacterium]
MENARKVDLCDSIRYREGLDERQIFSRFREWALRSDPLKITAHLTHPRTPFRPKPGEGL